MSVSRNNKSKALPGQMDLFAAPANDVVKHKAPFLAPTSVPEVKADRKAPAVRIDAPKRGRPIKIEMPAPAQSREPVWSPREEWWTTQMVCAFLKISRKTLWERRRAKDLQFPQPAQLGGARNLYRAASVRGWAERMADAEC